MVVLGSISFGVLVGVVLGSYKHTFWWRDLWDFANSIMFLKTNLAQNLGQYPYYQQFNWMPPQVELFGAARPALMFGAATLAGGAHRLR